MLAHCAHLRFNRFAFDPQLVRECKEVLKGGLLMKQYYQFMLRGVVTDAQGLQTNANIDEFEEDLHKMLVVRSAKFPWPGPHPLDSRNTRPRSAIVETSPPPNTGWREVARGRQGSLFAIGGVLRVAGNRWESR